MLATSTKQPRASTVFGLVDEQSTFATYIQPNHNYSYENVAFAEHDNQIVGMALGFSAQQYRIFLRSH